ncbi:TonB-dependent receptor [Arenibacter sp. GZD96]|uniref:TonB-dependent receptor n=1 Tax=Aurantibrevibacter litoralis TaxID=3106030 RepID=UPI002AFE72A5|nr:TonB-dependent receptor [Arenibacter sp. GZD-96]MEA1786412.1 TonB-dependent receptor [Arenibacter sp. GZD-96]
MNKIYIFVLALSYLLISVPLWAQETYVIQGDVTANGVPIAFAQIWMQNTALGAQSDAEGHFILQVPYPHFTLEVRSMGYLPFTKTFDLDNTPNRHLQIHLQESAIALEGVVLLDKQSGLTRRTPYAIATMETQSITKMANPGGVAGLLKEIPGISGAEMGPGIVKPFIRGLGFSRVVTLFQNNKLENHPWGQDHGLGLNAVGVKGVDVIKGPASILYGSGAVGGVLLVRDDEEYLSSEGSTATIGSSFNGVSNGIRNFVSVGNTFTNGLFMALDAGIESHADYKDGNNRIIGNSRFNNKTIRIHSGIYQKNQFKNKLSFTFHEQQLGIIDDNEMQVSLTTSRNDRKLQLPFQKIRDYLLSYTQEHTFDNSEINFHLSHHFNDRNEIETDFDAIDLGLKQYHTFMATRFTWKPKNGFIHTLGTQGSLIKTRNKKGTLELLIPNANTADIGFYYLGSKPLGKFYLQTGLRFDYRRIRALANSQDFIDFGFTLAGDPENRTLTTDFSGFTGSLGVSYTPDDRQQWKLNFSSGFRAPDSAELFSNGNHPGTSRFEVGSPTFNREQSLQTDLSYSFASSAISFGASVYTNVISNYIFFTNTGEVRQEDGLEIWAFQQADALLYGSEWELTYNPLDDASLQFNLNGAVVRGRLSDSKENLTFIPADNFGFSTTYKPSFLEDYKFNTQITHHSTQSRPGFNELSTPRYTLVQAGISKAFRLPKGTLNTSLSVQNLFNKTYLDHLSILRAFAIPHPGRNWQLAIMYRL